MVAVRGVVLFALPPLALMKNGRQLNDIHVMISVVLTSSFFFYIGAVLHAFWLLYIRDRGGIMKCKDELLHWLETQIVDIFMLVKRGVHAIVESCANLFEKLGKELHRYTSPGESLDYERRRLVGESPATIGEHRAVYALTSQELGKTPASTSEPAYVSAIASIPTKVPAKTSRPKVSASKSEQKDRACFPKSKANQSKMKKMRAKDWDNVPSNRKELNEAYTKCEKERAQHHWWIKKKFFLTGNPDIDLPSFRPQLTATHEEQMQLLASKLYLGVLSPNLNYYPEEEQFFPPTEPRSSSISSVGELAKDSDENGSGKSSQLDRYYTPDEERSNCVNAQGELGNTAEKTERDGSGEKMADDHLKELVEGKSLLPASSPPKTLGSDDAGLLQNTKIVDTGSRSIEAHQQCFTLNTSAYEEKTDGKYGDHQTLLGKRFEERITHIKLPAAHTKSTIQIADESGDAGNTNTKKTASGRREEFVKVEFPLSVKLPKVIVDNESAVDTADEAVETGTTNTAVPVDGKADSGTTGFAALETTQAMQEEYSKSGAQDAQVGDARESKKALENTVDMGKEAG